MKRRFKLTISPRLRLILAVFLLFAMIGLKTAPVAGENAPAKSQVVTLTIDYGDGVQKRFTALPWKKGMTVLDALNLAQNHPRGIKFKYQGTRGTALLHKIDDLENRGGRKENWLFYVNDKFANRGFGVSKLQANDNVLWKFAPYRKK